ncbi:MAG: RNA methyltransferase [Anaerolinea sp.]|nr:RNA methyltransferase [Anaerolinea sp.]
MAIIVIRQCVRKACSFRFPVDERSSQGLNCPKCGSNTDVIDSLAGYSAGNIQQHNSSIHLEGFLDNIRSVFNVGSIFRSAEGCGMRTLHLGGTTPPPTHPRMTKTALGAEDSVPWTQHWDGLAAVREIKSLRYHVIGMESTPESIPLYHCKIVKKPTLLVVGNETHGIDPDILSECDEIIHSPMAGKKESLNVAIAFSIAAYWIMYGGK